MLDAQVRQFFSCCFADDHADAHQISYASDPKLEEGNGGPLRMPPSSGHFKLPVAGAAGLGGNNMVDSARSHGSAPSTARSLTPEERQKEKERLQDMVKEFAKAVVQGQQCQWLDPTGIGGPKPATYFFDKGLSTFSLRLEDRPPISFHMVSIQEVMKDHINTPFASLRLHRDSADHERRFACLQYEDGGELNHLGILLPNPYERERFYTCMKILRWAMDSRREKSVG
jgi:hypothetical protein